MKRRRKARAGWMLDELSEEKQRQRRERYRCLKGLGASGKEAWRASMLLSEYRKLKLRLLSEKQTT